MYVDSRFLNLVQALESYHRRRMKNEVLPRIDHRKRVRTILRNVEPDHRPWLKEHLQYSNEPRLRNRLLDLLGRARDVMAPLIGNNEGAFAKTVTDTRNFLIHYDQHLKSQSLGGEDLFFVTEKLSILLQSCLLLELGLSAEKCLKLFQRNEDYQWATSRPWTLN